MKRKIITFEEFEAEMEAKHRCTRKPLNLTVFKGRGGYHALCGVFKYLDPQEAVNFAYALKGQNNRVFMQGFRNRFHFILSEMTKTRYACQPKGEYWPNVSIPVHSSHLLRMVKAAPTKSLRFRVWGHVISTKRTLPNLEQLEICGATYVDRYPSFAPMENLHTLTLKSVHLGNPATRAVTHPKSLKRLIMVKCNGIIATLTALSKANSLEHLELVRMRFVNVPECVGAFTNLRTLSLRDNLITEIPLHMQRLTKLEKLDVSNCRIHWLGGLVGMRNLRELDLHCSPASHSNNFYLLPDCIYKFPRLKLVNIKGGNYTRGRSDNTQFTLIN